jgi:hypothetical protein
LQDYEIVLDADVAADPSNPPATSEIASRKQSGGMFDSTSDELFGIVRITTIESSDVSAQYWHSSDDQELVGVFWGF